jgi:hypothetical protein
MKKVVVLSASVALISTSFMANATGVVSGDIVARDLVTEYGAFLGHTAMVTGDPVGQRSSLIIEVTNNPPDGQKIQFNDINTFKHQARYWGNRFGLGSTQSLYQVLVEMNYQRWWCPRYTITDQYEVGTGNIQTGQPYHCGKWRCDTLINWAFGVTGHMGFPLPVTTPGILFSVFPMWGERFAPEKEIHPPLLTSTDKVFTELSADELNKLPFEEFKMLADVPLNQVTPSHIVAEWKLANNPRVEEVRRGMFIDRLSMTNERDVIPQFIKMYEKEENEVIKGHLVRGTMSYYQYRYETIKNTYDGNLLKAFYKKLVTEKEFSKEGGFSAIMGFIFFHSTDEIIENKEALDKQLGQIDHSAAVTLMWDLAHKSQRLETLYVPSLIEMLRKDKSSDLNEKFFGISKMGWRHFRNKESVDLIRTYVKENADRYEAKKPSFADQHDPYFMPATWTYKDLKNDFEKAFAK